MKKIMISILLGLTLLGCSSSSDSKPGAVGGGVVTEFGNKSAGQWLSECVQSQDGQYKETLVINKNGTGNRTLNFYPDQNCQGQIIQSQGPTGFNYTAEAAVNGVSKVTLTVTGQQPVQVKVSIQNDAMDITSDQGSVRYARVGHAPTTPGQVNPAPQNPNDFDSWAIGNWATEQCYQYENNQTVRQVITIRGQGRGSSVLNVYPSADCSGNPHPEQNQNISYTVTRFANGGGEISINGRASDISFQTNRMTVSSAEGSTVFVKIN